MSVVFFFKQKTAYEMRISDWSSDVCSSDLVVTESKVVTTSRSALGDVYLLGGTIQLNGVVVTSTSSSDGAKGTSGGKEIGRASSRERVCQYVSISVVAVSLKKK